MTGTGLELELAARLATESRRWLITMKAFDGQGVHLGRFWTPGLEKRYRLGTTTSRMTLVILHFFAASLSLMGNRQSTLTSQLPMPPKLRAS
ncbi:hypothetical protein K437DRAFT_253695 [Tilletiaria anomala UBC 951]|uniref:Uncharacterized protein n=1 Tax=Tilletiaria anomala (strain ATCC 24038 / CBS 436.72 / UBC 951) TaxID=1037660 RepID=A0A066WFL9_TILAU|nr:uncharacterized protein K437DRAFT_253695 [Tilletiaria anomala UBC 951]KDN52772.1 hypothetical protein K437DRAFT_253695 [Tilletiaria anomala UBC 951]